MPVHDGPDRGRNPVLRDELEVNGSEHKSADARGRTADKSPVEPDTPGGPTRSVLPVHDGPDRGRNPVLRDELAVVVSQHVNDGY
jgi:hypothetical protein